MATTAITPKQLTWNTRSDDILDGDGTVAATPADGWAIALGTRGTTDRLILKFLADGTGDTVVITAGDMPPAMRAGLGSLSITLAANDVRYLALEPGRFEQNDNTIVATCSDSGTTCLAFLLPVTTGGGSGIG